MFVEWKPGSVPVAESPCRLLILLLAEEWGTLTDEAIEPYIGAAEVDRERYYREVTEYNNPDAVTNKKQKDTRNVDDSDSPSASKDAPYLNGKEEKWEIKVGDYEIPIFTEDFLEHNNVIDSELRMLRKSNIDYKQQNSVMENHVENMENGIEKLENESSSMKPCLRSYRENIDHEIFRVYDFCPSGKLRFELRESVPKAWQIAYCLPLDFSQSMLCSTDIFLAYRKSLCQVFLNCRFCR